MNSTLQNGFGILEYMANKAEECSGKELAEYFSLPNSNVSRLLKTLSETGYVERVPGSSKYRISLKILNLSNARLRKLRFRTVAQPSMRQLMRELSRPIYLYANFRGLAIIVSSELAELSATGHDLTVGTIHVPNCFEGGQVCAAYASPAELPQVLERCNWTAYTASSITTREAFLEELELIRRRGYAMSSETIEPNLGGIAVPIFNGGGRLAGAIGVMLPRDKNLWTPSLTHDWITKLKQAAESISFALGHCEE